MSTDSPWEPQGCHDCRYWFVEDGVGYCRRNPPSPAAPTPPPGEDDEHGTWPVTYPEDWCGEWARETRSHDQ